MNKIACFGFALFLSVSSPIFADLLLDFNTPGQFTGNFSSAQDGPTFQSSTGGLNDGGSLDLSGMAGAVQQIVTFNHAFSGDLASWSTSLYYHGNAQSFWQFGVIADETPELLDGYGYGGGAYSPAIWVESGNNEGGAFAIVSFDGNDWLSDSVVVDGGLPTSAAWYKYTISVNYLGASNYSISATLQQADAEGTPGLTLATSSLSIENAALANDDSVYLYFNLSDGLALDDFYTTTYTDSAIPEPGSYAAFAGLFTLGFVAWRRHAKRA